MGGHGGLNILPQKRWNVYNYENREKVRRDEEAAAREEQLKREQVRKRDAEFRLERLRATRGLAPLNQSQAQEEQPDESAPKSGHINLFEGIKIFDPIRVPEKDAGERDGLPKKKMMKKEDGGSSVVVTPEDEKYRFGYSYVGKGVKLPWYLQKLNDVDDGESSGGGGGDRGEKGEKKRSGKKTLEELREERLKRERSEKERERALRHEKQKSDRDVYGSKRYSRR